MALKTSSHYLQIHSWYWNGIFKKWADLNIVRKWPYCYPSPKHFIEVSSEITDSGVYTPHILLQLPFSSETRCCFLAKHVKSCDHSSESVQGHSTTLGHLQPCKWMQHCIELTTRLRSINDTYCDFESLSCFSFTSFLSLELVYQAPLMWPHFTSHLLSDLCSLLCITEPGKQLFNVVKPRAEHYVLLLLQCKPLMRTDANSLYITVNVASASYVEMCECQHYRMPGLYK